MASLVSSTPLCAAEIGAPVLGYVFDARVSGLRPILGILGASRLGEPLDIGNVRLSGAAVSPEQDYAVGLEEQGNGILLLALNQKPVAVTRLDKDNSLVEQIVLSPGGESAVLVSNNRRSLRVLTGLPDSPHSLGVLDLSPLPGTLGGLAVRDDGQQLMLDLRDGNGSALYAANPKGEINGVTRLGSEVTIQYFREGQAAVITDSGNSQILKVNGANLKVEVLASLAFANQVFQPVALALSDDGQRLFIVSKQPNQLMFLSLQSRQMAQIPLSGKITGLDRLMGDSVFRLNELSETPLLVLKGGGTEPRIVFVPASKGTNQPDAGLFRSPRGDPRPVSVRERRPSR